MPVDKDTLKILVIVEMGTVQQSLNEDAQIGSSDSLSGFPYADYMR